MVEARHPDPKFNRRNAFASLLEAAEYMKEKIDLYGGKDPRELPAYGISEAAHYLQLPRATLRSWVLGQPYITQKGPQFFAPLIDLADKRPPPAFLFQFSGSSRAQRTPSQT
jgi:hypothetical protein